MSNDWDYDNRSGRKLKKWVIPVAVILIIAVLGGIGFGAYHFISGKNTESNNSTTVAESSGVDITKKPTETTEAQTETTTTTTESTTETTTESSDAIKGYVNTFSGYTGLFAANGGNKTADGSNFASRGLNVEINIEDNDDNIIKAFENGDIQFFAMTVNKMALVTKQLEDAGIQVVMPFFLDTSTGGDGIVADADVKTITDLKNVKIGMARNSVSTAIPVWFLNNSGLSEDEVQKIVDNFELFDSTQEAVDAFVSGEVGAVSTWNMTGALAKENSHLLFSTSSAEYLVIDGLVFNKEFVESHESEVQQMIDGIVATVNDINNGVNTATYYQSIRSSVPDYAELSDEEIASEISYAKFLNFNGNVKALEVAGDIYGDFCKIWQQLGFETDESYQLIDSKYITALGSSWDGVETSDTSEVTNAEEYVDQEALISQYAKILFNGDSAEFKTGYEQTDREMIDEFIKVAKILNKTVIKISGHVNLGEGSTVWDDASQTWKIAPGFESSEFAYLLSNMRADTVKEYMVSKGIPESRIITEGLGGDYPIDSNDTEEGRANNRSCEISFYQAGY